MAALFLFADANHPRVPVSDMIPHDTKILKNQSSLGIWTPGILECPLVLCYLCNFAFDVIASARSTAPDWHAYLPPLKSLARMQSLPRVANMSTIYMPALIFKFRVHIFRLCIHRRHARLENICSLTHIIAPRPAPSAAPTAETQPMTEIITAPSFPKKKALLIGICGTGDLSKKKKGRRPLKGPHNDVKAMYDLLIGQCSFFNRLYQIYSTAPPDLYGYTHGQITQLLDDGKPENTQPTQEHIVGVSPSRKSSTS